ncbi:MAG: ATP-binding cassette domain-containing protein [Proteobacteria bacterium]|nr:ATP-binding cassette domain-containing protein [Pseudomonadota bacterium]
MSNSKRANALPFLGRGPALDEHNSEPEQAQGFLAVAMIFARTWPFIRPYIVGYWREVRLGEDSPELPQSEARDFAASDGSAATPTATEKDWSFKHIPPLATLTAALGPLLGVLPLNTSWVYDFLLVVTACMAGLSWSLLYVRQSLYVGFSTALVVLGACAFLFAVFAVDGVTANIFIAVMCLVSAGIWLLQYRIDAGKLRLRIRLGSHLIYYFVGVWVSTLLLLLISLFSVDVVSQSILQAKPLTPFIADLVSQPELAGAASNTLEQGSTAAAEGSANANANVDLAPLSDAERHDLKWLYAVFLFVGWIAQLPLSLALPYYYIYIMQRVNQDLRVALLERWHRLSLRYHSNHRVGDSVYRLYQDSAQVTAVVGEITQALQILITYFTGIVFLFALDPILGLMALAIVLGALAWGRWFSPRMRSNSLASRQANSDFTSRVQETFASTRLIKAFGAEAREQARFEQDSLRAFNAAYRVRTLMAIIGIITFTIAAGALLYGQYLTAIWAFGERETYASVLVGLVGLSFLRWNLSAYQSAQEYLGAASVSIRDLVERWTRAQDMAMGLHRVFDMLDIEPDVQTRTDAKPMPPLQQEIRFDRVSFAYEPERPVLRDVNFTVTPGTVTAIVGPTGSGKSSLMSLLSRLFDPDTGSVSIDGVDLRDIDLDALRANVSVALQENVLFGISLRDNIRYVVPDASDEQVLKAVEVACVEEYVAGLPDGLDTILSDRGGKLSTGQRQRLSIARALVKGAPILVLDEPTAALDAATEHRVLQRLADWAEQRVVFLITHRISTIAQADNILYIDEGQLIEQGSHDELMQLQGGRYRRFVETEAQLAKRISSEPARG